MFFDILIFVWFLIKFDQNPANYVKKIVYPAPVPVFQEAEEYE
jgi:hypothetical protein